MLEENFFFFSFVASPDGHTQAHTHTRNVVIIMMTTVSVFHNNNFTPEVDLPNMSYAIKLALELWWPSLPTDATNKSYFYDIACALLPGASGELQRPRQRERGRETFANSEFRVVEAHVCFSSSTTIFHFSISHVWHSMTPELSKLCRYVNWCAVLVVISIFSFRPGIAYIHTSLTHFAWCEWCVQFTRFGCRWVNGIDWVAVHSTNNAQDVIRWKREFVWWNLWATTTSFFCVRVSLFTSIKISSAK